MRTKTTNHLAKVVRGALKKLLQLFKTNTLQLSTKPPVLRRVQIIEFLSFDDAFARSYAVVQVKDVFRHEIKNVYEVQLRYMNGGVYLLEEEGI